MANSPGARRTNIAAIAAGLAGAVAVLGLAVSPSLAQRLGPPTAIEKALPVKGARPITQAQYANLERLRAATRLRAPQGISGRARNAAMATTLPVYLERMRTVWRTADANGDWSLAWQGATPTEPLPAAVNACAIVKYDFVPAKKEKDPSKPGVWIDTPAQYVPNGWLSYPEMLATMSVATNQCEALGLEIKHTCLINGQKVYWGELQSGGRSVPGWNINLNNPWTGRGAICWPSSSTSCGLPGFKAQCAQKGGEYIAETVINGCERFTTLGPDSQEAFLEVAKENFIAEDKNADGVVTPAESQYLCQP
jgi:hypothetical protein